MLFRRILIRTVLFRLVSKQHRFRATERVEIRDDDRVAGFQAIDDLHVAQAACPDFDAPSFDEALLCQHISDPPGTAVEELSSLHHQYVRMFGQKYASHQTLVLAQIGRSVFGETNACIDVVVDDLRGHRDELAGIAFAANEYFRLHPDGKIVCIRLGNLRIDFESTQVDDGHDRCISRYRLFLLYQQVAHDAVDRRSDGKIIHLSLQIRDKQFLTLEFEFAGLQFEGKSFVQKIGICNSVFVGEFGVSQVVMRFFIIDDGYDAQFVRLICASLLPFRRDQCDFCEVGCLALFERVLPRLYALPFEIEAFLFERGAGLLQLAVEFRAIDSREYLARDHRFAGDDFECDSSAGRRIKCWTDCGDYATLDRDVLDEVAAGDTGQPNPVDGHTDGRIGPALYPGCCQPGEYDKPNEYAAGDDLASAFAGWCYFYVLR